MRAVHWFDPSVAAAQTNTRRARVKPPCQTDPESRRIIHFLGFAPQITKALPHLFCKKACEVNINTHAVALTSKCQGTFFRGLGAVEHIQRSGSRSPVKLTGQSTSLIVCWKSLPKATKHKRRADYPRCRGNEILQTRHLNRFLDEWQELLSSGSAASTQSKKTRWGNSMSSRGRRHCWLPELTALWNVLKAGSVPWSLELAVEMRMLHKHHEEHLPSPQWMTSDTADRDWVVSNRTL